MFRARTGERAYVNLEVPRLVRNVRDPAAVGRKHRQALVKRCLQEGLGLTSLAERQNPDVTRRLAVDFMVREVLGVRREGRWKLPLLVIAGQRLAFAGTVSPDHPDAMFGFRVRDETTVRRPHRPPF